MDIRLLKREAVMRLAGEVCDGQLHTCGEGSGSDSRRCPHPYAYRRHRREDISWRIKRHLSMIVFAALPTVILGQRADARLVSAIFVLR